MTAFPFPAWNRLRDRVRAMRDQFNGCRADMLALSYDLRDQPFPEVNMLNLADDVENLANQMRAMVRESEQIRKGQSEARERVDAMIGGVH